MSLSLLFNFLILLAILNGEKKGLSKAVITQRDKLNKYHEFDDCLILFSAEVNSQVESRNDPMETEREA